MVLNSIADMIDEIERAADGEGIMDVYAAVAKQIDSREGGAYDEIYRETGSQQGVVDWCGKALPDFGTLYAKWHEVRDANQRKRQVVGGVVKWGVILAGGFGISLAKELKKDYERYYRR